jgi:hypothetical protein
MIGVEFQRNEWCVEKCRSVSSLDDEVAVYWPVLDITSRRPDCAMGSRRGDSGAPGVVESPSKLCSYKWSIAETWRGAVESTESTSVSHCSLLLLLDARAISCLRLRRADLAQTLASRHSILSQLEVTSRQFLPERRSTAHLHRLLLARMLHD